MLASHKKTIYETLGRHPIHPFPARMAPGIALDALAGSKKQLRVLDPMMGSGTVLAVARANGHYAIGTDLDPLAVLLSKVWTSTIDSEYARNKALDVLLRAKKIFPNISSRNAYPKNSDKETQKFIRYWFDDYARRQLTALSCSISGVRNAKIRDVLWCAFSRLIITKSVGASLAMDLSHSRPHKKYRRAPAKPFRRFMSAVETVIANCPKRKSHFRGPATKIYRGDARSLKIEDKSVDLVLTSPPYLNAIDYMRCSKFSLVWMGYSVSEIRNIRGKSVGVERMNEKVANDTGILEIIQHLKLSPKLKSRDQAILSQYITDMQNALSETSRVLKKSGRAVYVVGESTVRGTYIRNSKIVIAAAKQSGLKLVSRNYRELPANRRYLPPPKVGATPSSIEGRMRREVVLLFKK